MLHTETEGDSPTGSGSSAAGSPLPVPVSRRTSIKWRSLGVFSNDVEMTAIRNSRKVSKRKTDVLRHGRKVTYRCNSWKRTRCPYQMYALYAKGGFAELFETVAEHKHDATSKKESTPLEETEADETGEDVPAMEPDEKPEEGSLEEDAVLEVSRPLRWCRTLSFQDTSSLETFKIADHASGLLEIAKELDLSVSFNLCGSHEFVFASVQPHQTVQVVFEEGEGDVRVSVRLEDSELHAETWTKSSWAQFFWALRGKCWTVLVQNRP
ncbi:hypothetical protein QR680_005380 [Steinernema hermaphroditum]|uniref:Uncharacterized protein n=1 Tax=Steinernema hermaphroditum TaxID=289476 RepID=A0AA39HU35_9BILA|nr:hypothetical protein QR680_005380 [Steinernema hermaphroditum]